MSEKLKVMQKTIQIGLYVLVNGKLKFVKAMIGDEHAGDLKKVLKTLAEALRVADFGYVKTLTANCSDNIKHEGYRSDED